MPKVNHGFRIGDKVFYPSDYGPFEVVGIRENSVEILGDFSGGTRNVSQSSWVLAKEVKIYEDVYPELVKTGKVHPRISIGSRLQLLKDVDMGSKVYKKGHKFTVYGSEGMRGWNLIDEHGSKLDETAMISDLFMQVG